MMFHTKPKPVTLHVKIGGSLVLIAGWESCYTLGIARGNETNYFSVATMSGTLLIDGFSTIEDAHAFNRLLIDHPKVFLGTPTVEEMYQRSGGEPQFFKVLTECAKKVQKRKAA